MKKNNFVFLFALSLMLLSGMTFAQIQYQLPPEEIIELVDAPSTPSMVISPDNQTVLLIDNPDLPGIEDLAAPEYRLAGLRFNPVTNGGSRGRFGTGLRFMNLDGTNERPVQGLPKSPKISNTSWSPNGKMVAFTHTTGTGIELWVADVETSTARKLTGEVINDVLGNSFSWLSDNKTIVYSAIPEGRGPTPTRPTVADGPVVQESIGRRAAVRTFQDLLKDPYDEAIFDYYATSQLVKIDLDGNSQKIGEPGVIYYFNPSPDGQYLLTTTVQKPYSYIVPMYRFPQKIELLDMNGRLVRLLVEVPLTDNLPQGFSSVRTGARSHTWRSDKPASLWWVEALDGGDPAVEAEYRDQLFYLEAPFTAEPTPSLQLELRYGGITWGRDDFAMVSESWRATRRMKLSSFNPGDASLAMSLLFDRSMEDRYNDPGRFETTLNEYGRRVLQFDRRQRFLYLTGQGASPEGNQPFLDEYDLRTGLTKRLWQSEAPWYEIPVSLVDADRGLLITRRESVDVQPNYYMRDLRRNRLTQITHFPDPSPKLRELQKELVHYERADGIPLSGTLYLPDGFQPGVDAPLPTMLWAYPREFKSADAAGQVSGSPYTYTRVGATSAVMLATLGYAVLDNASFPIVGEGDEEPNDTFVEQLVANAEAAINKLVEMGVTDPDRVAVSGHSYGAFMTANLLSHCDLFAAGIARSGAYNRTLTPFGFQGEERTYWQSPEVYNTMSPFMNADKVKAPMLLIHGIDDNNSGTFPIQSERYYDALRGHGATVRLVMLPHESHGYSARESVLHMHWEWINWLDKYVKNRVVER
ncbi:MAG: prolyl oligopeptidase family serine peptidase [Bacteroides sp.]|jgi:dipeptidyl aminopeptidase/acylaminoacyl peptidase|nr:prolyl oligopeptidase family serine peptidase [Bacteroides sp.]